MTLFAAHLILKDYLITFQGKKREACLYSIFSLLTCFNRSIKQTVVATN